MNAILRSSFAEFLRRLTAIGCGGLLLALTVLAASPRLHERVHRADNTAGEDGCAVVLFANGIVLAATAVAVAAPRRTWVACTFVAYQEIWLVASRYLRQPERGPPLS